MKNKINLGIIGKNFGYKVIYKSFLKNKNFKIIGFSFKKKNKNIKLPKKVKVYFDWKKMILNKKIDAVAIAAPPKLHKNIVNFAIKNNKHIFCEKPFTISFKQANFLCNQIKKKKNIAHMVNYEFANIDAFEFLKRKIINKIKIKKIYLDWFINIQKRSKSNWKEQHALGGGIMFNYVCHALYYLEFIFGKIKAIKSSNFLDKKNKLQILKSQFFFNNGLISELTMKVGVINGDKPIHQLKIIASKKTYILKTNLNSLADKFKLLLIKQNTQSVIINDKKNNSDFRLIPTYKNSKIFYNSIVNKKVKKPNFYDALRIHLIIKKMILSSEKNKKIFV